MIILTNEMNVEEIKKFNETKLEEISKFLSDECDFIEGVQISFRALYISYRKYCERNNLFPVRRSVIWATMKQMGFRRTVIEGKSFWLNVRSKHAYDVRQ